jgi:hypothetical protein
MRLRKPGFWLAIICPILAISLVQIWKPGDSIQQELTQDTSQKRQISQTRATRENGSAVMETQSRRDFPAMPGNSLPDDPATSQQEILEAMTLYSREGLPPLVAYLRHHDPEIVALAIEAIVQLGQPEGAEVLRSAARRTSDQMLMQEMLDAADFLELPEYSSEH